MSLCQSRLFVREACTDDALTWHNLPNSPQFFDEPDPEPMLVGQLGVPETRLADGSDSDLDDSPAPLSLRPVAPHLCMAPRMPCGVLAKMQDSSWRPRNQDCPRSSCTSAKRRARSGTRQLPAVELPPQACSPRSLDAPLFNKRPPTILAPAPSEESTLPSREQSAHEGTLNKPPVAKAQRSKGDVCSRLLILPPNARRACAEAPTSPPMNFSPIEAPASQYSVECPDRLTDTPDTPGTVNSRRCRSKASPASFKAAVPNALMRPARFAQPQQFHRQHLSGIFSSATKRPTVPTSCRSHRASGHLPETPPVAEVEKAPYSSCVPPSSMPLFNISKIESL